MTLGGVSTPITQTPVSGSARKYTNTRVKLTFWVRPRESNVEMGKLLLYLPLYISATIPPPINFMIFEYYSDCDNIIRLNFEKCFPPACIS